MVRKKRNSPLIIFGKLTSLLPEGTIMISYPSRYETPKFLRDPKVCKIRRTRRRFERTRTTLPRFNGCVFSWWRLISSRIFQIPDWSSLHLVCQPRLTKNFEHLISLFNANFVCTKVKLSLVELGHIRQSRGRPGRLRKKVPRQSTRLLRSGRRKKYLLIFGF